MHQFDTPEEYILVADKLIQEFKGGDAVSLLEEAFGRWPNDVRVVYSLAYVQARQNLFINALRTMQEARRLQPEAYDTWFLLGMIYHAMGNIRLTFQAYEKARMLDPARFLRDNIDILYDCSDGGA